ncbi:MAG: hypothetical protein RSA54_10380, partial [Glutamicibacter sp.]
QGLESRAACVGGAARAMADAVPSAPTARRQRAAGAAAGGMQSEGISCVSGAMQECANARRRCYARVHRAAGAGDKVIRRSRQDG